MNTGVTYIEINYDRAWVDSSLKGVQGFAWLFEWGMYLFLFATLAVLLWIFYDSITKRKDQKALIPRIFSMIGFFAILPAFIFRFTGNADGVTTLVKLNAENPVGYYSGAINWNVKWLVAGFGPVIAIIALIGVIMSIAAIVIYASSVQRAKPSTEFVRAFDNRMSNLENKVQSASSPAPKNGASSLSDVMGTDAAKPAGTPAPTVFDRKPQAATIIDTPKSGYTLSVQAGGSRGYVYELPMSTVTVGRDPKSFIVLDDGKVSGSHVKFLYNNDIWSVLDLGSTNGTYLNNVKITGQEQLSSGDTIKVGDTLLVFGESASPRQP